jgi:hypothetical protein
MIKRAAALGTLCLLLLTSVACAQDSLSELQKLYSEKRYFELRDELKAYNNETTPELFFFRGAVDNIFNRLPESIENLRAYIDKVGKSTRNSWTQECYDLLADSYRKSHQYGKAAEINHKILELFKHRLDADSRADHENEYKLWNALKDFPPQYVSFLGHTRLQMERNHVPFTINGHDIALTYDTGADLSVIISSRAEEFGLEVVDIPIKVGTITGEKVDAKVGVAEVLRIGNMTVQHALFLVMKDEYFYIPEIKHQIEGVIGFPVLAAMREVTFTRGGELIIPHEPESKGEQNLALNGLKPLIEGLYRGQRMTFVLDTGANRSDLWPPFYHTFKQEIEENSPLKSEKFRGAGSQIEVKSYDVENVIFRFAGEKATFMRMPVFIEYTTDNSRHFYGNLGQDLVRKFKSMTINFESMSVIFK